MGEFETLDALRAEMRKGLERRREQENRRALEDAVIEAALAAHTFEVPESMVLRQVGHQIEHIREQMRRQGMDPERVPWDYKKMLEEMRPGAEKAVKRALLIEAIAEKEGLGAEPTPTSTPRSSASRRPASGRRPPCARCSSKTATWIASASRSGRSARSTSLLNGPR